MNQLGDTQNTPETANGTAGNAYRHLANRFGRFRRSFVPAALL